MTKDEALVLYRRMANFAATGIRIRLAHNGGDFPAAVLDEVSGKPLPLGA